jgi:NADH-quinone oxidoreductase subunit M
VALGAFAGARGDAADASAITGGIFQVFNHGLIMAFLFALDDKISIDGRSLSMAEVGGLRAGQGRLTALMLVSLFAAASLPGMSNFAGEILVYFAAFRVSPWYAMAAGLGALITAAAMIRIFHHLFFGPKRGDVQQASDLRIPEVVLGLAVVSVWLVLGFYPMLFVGPVEKAFAVAVAGVAP